MCASPGCVRVHVRQFYGLLHSVSLLPDLHLSVTLAALSNVRLDAAPKTKRKKKQKQNRNRKNVIEERERGKKPSFFSVKRMNMDHKYHNKLKT